MSINKDTNGNSQIPENPRSSSTETSRSNNKSRYTSTEIKNGWFEAVKFKYKFIFSVLLIFGLAISIFLLPIRDWLIILLEWTKGLGILGPVAAAGFYVVGSVLFLPGSFLTMSVGFLFKVVVGTITVSIGSTIGASAAFLISRTFGRKWIAARIARSRLFTAIDHAVERDAVKIVVLTRLSPACPYNMLNYAFGLTKIPFWKYALVSWVSMLPSTIMYTYLGSGLRSLASVATGQSENGNAEKVFFWFGLAATVAVTICVTNIVRKAIKHSIPKDEIPESDLAEL